MMLYNQGYWVHFIILTLILPMFVFQCIVLFKQPDFPKILRPVPELMNFPILILCSVLLLYSYFV